MGEGDARFSQLRRRVEGVSQKMLAHSLRGLERDGLVRRTVYPQVPVQAECGLTDAGRTLLEPLRALEEWSIEHPGDVSASREAYDRVDCGLMTRARGGHPAPGHIRTRFVANR
ncbi:winged helix-turn-helix transcriptional regulator [Leifsonia sp. Root112D2]|uniref:winged helix-turn-helix transcriptional regulator n=1 Tax=Leifsonia sp. Root112D2 TaxID=1736426 RepID=UPI0022856594|nr:helix-turn-helix domain-containing protein [Leifsonia sp. Root112D2]